MADSEPLKCGVAGVGYLGQHHARLYTELPSTELVGVYDVNPKRAREVADRHGGRVFASLADLGAACEAVSVVTPTDTHAAVADALLAAGCHLLVEKPICPTVEEARAIAKAAAARGRMVQVGHVEHFNPVMTYLEKKVRDPRFLTADRLAPNKERGVEVSVVLDLMIHDIGIILKLVKSPVARVDAVGVNVITKSVDLANARLTFANGAVANLNASRVSLQPKRELRVFQPDTYLSLNFAEQKGHLVRKGPVPLPGMLGFTKTDIPVEKGEPLKIELAAFAEAIRGHEPPEIDATFGTTALEVALAVSAAIDAGLPSQHR